MHKHCCCIFVINIKFYLPRMNRFISYNTNNIQCFLNRLGQSFLYKSTNVFVYISIIFAKFIT